jgi:hypothetical protein
MTIYRDVVFGEKQYEPEKNTFRLFTVHGKLAFDIIKNGY